MKKRILFIFIISVMFILTGCSFKPTYYSKAEVKSFVKDTFGSQYKLKSVNQGEDNSEEKNKMYEYIFENDEGFKFSVYSITAHFVFDATELSTYDKFLRSNYLSAMMNYKSNELKKIIESLSFKADVNYSNGYIYFYLSDYSQLEEAATAIIDIDKLFNFNYKENRVIYKVGVSIRYTQSSKTNGYVTTLYLSNDDNSRLGYSVVLDELKKEINNSVSQ